MPKLSYKDKLPPADEFQNALAEAMAETNPIDDLLDLANDLWEFEQKYQITSADFYEKYQRGLLDDELQHCITWVVTYEFFIKTKRKLDETAPNLIDQLLISPLKVENFKPLSRIEIYPS